MSDSEVFDWDDYMSRCRTEPVPEGLFEHVEKSLYNEIDKSAYVEIIHNENLQVYWVAEIVLVCGHLLSLKFIGADKDQWYDLTKEKVYQLGWCKSHDIPMEPPDHIAEKHDSDYLIDLVQKTVADAPTVSQEVLSREGGTPIDRLKVGMKLEVQNERDPYKFWIATVMRNVGGRLCLEYDGYQIASKIWLFYTSQTLRYFGYVSDEGPPYKFQHPNGNSKMRQGEVISAQLRQSATEAARMPTPKDLFMGHTKPAEHSFTVGMKMEVLNPYTLSTYHPATVVKIYDKFHVLVAIDDYITKYETEENSCFLVTSSSPYAFPVGWVGRHGLYLTKPAHFECSGTFDWKKYLTSATALATEEMFTEKHHAYYKGFRASMTLESVNPLDRGEICVAKICKIVEHLLLVEMIHSKKQHWIWQDSSDIFPVHWCSTHEYDLTFPLLPDNLEESTPSMARIAMEEETCDRIYFNYKCYSGTFISKNKLAQLPKYVGPGPFSLVIKEVMNLVISSAYKPGKLLKDLEHEGEISSDIKLETLKAKLKLSTYHAKVQVAAKNEDVAKFCRDMCAKLQACPFLFGPIEINECPEKCLQVDKSKFVSNFWSSGKRKRRKGLHFMTIRARERRAAMENEKNAREAADSGNESDNSPSSTPQQSEAGTRPQTPESGGEPAKKTRKRRHPKDHPRLEMKTRGAKLPNFALQMKEGHWGKKDVETMYGSTCVQPKKSTTDNSESESEDSISNEIQNDETHCISGVSDSEEPELKKLQGTPPSEPLPTNMRRFKREIEKDGEKLFHFAPDLRIKLSSNPLYWSTKDVYDYLMTTDCKLLASKLQEEEIDGHAFMRLNLPIMRDYLNLRIETALQLGNHVANVIYYYYNNYTDMSTFQD